MYHYLHKRSTTDYILTFGGSDFWPIHGKKPCKSMRTLWSNK